MDATDIARSSQHENALVFLSMKKALLSNTTAMLEESKKVRDTLSAHMVNGNLRGIDRSQIGALTNDTADYLVHCAWPEQLPHIPSNEVGNDTALQKAYGANVVGAARETIRYIDDAVEAFNSVQSLLKTKVSHDIGPEASLEDSMRYLEFKSQTVLDDHADQPDLIEELLEDAQAAAHTCNSQLLFSQALRQTAELFREGLKRPLKDFQHVTSSALGYMSLQDAVEKMAAVEFEEAEKVKAGVESLQIVLDDLAKKTGVSHADRLASNKELDFSRLWPGLRLDDVETFTNTRKQMLESGTVSNPIFGSIGTKGDRERRPTKVFWFDMKPAQIFKGLGLRTVDDAIANLSSIIGWTPKAPDGESLETRLRTVLGEWATRRDSLPALTDDQLREAATGKLARLNCQRITQHSKILNDMWSKVDDATMKMFDNGLSEIESARRDDKKGPAKSTLYDALRDTAESDKMLARALLDQLSAKEGSPEEMQSLRQLEEVINRTTKTRESVAQTWTDTLGASGESIRTLDDLRKYVPGSISKTGANSKQAARRRRRRQERSNTATSSTTATDVKSASQPQAIETTDAPETSALPERPAVQPSWANIVAKWASQSRSTSGLMKQSDSCRYSRRSLE